MPAMATDRFTVLLTAMTHTSQASLNGEYHVSLSFSAGTFRLRGITLEALAPLPRYTEKENGTFYELCTLITKASIMQRRPLTRAIRAVLRQWYRGM
jgi:hypothetical protein